jgi:hypothetical protein
MSPPPPPSNPEEVNQLVKDGATAAALGAGAMTARLLADQNKQSFGYVARRIGIACVVGFFSSMVVKEYIHSTGLQFAAVGALSYAGPEVCDYVLQYIRAKGEAQVKAAKGRKR